MHRTRGPSLPASRVRRRASKIPRKAARVLPLPVGEVSRIDSRLRMLGSERVCAWVSAGYVSLNHVASLGGGRPSRRASFLFTRCFASAACVFRIAQSLWHAIAARRKESLPLDIVAGLAL